jgi:hypothetical protein
MYIESLLDFASMQPFSYVLEKRKINIENINIARI